MMPKDALTKLLVKQAVDALNAVSATLERLKPEMLQLASQLPEFPVVMAMRGVGDSLGPQLMAEIGDVTRFAHRGSITSFAGVDPGANQSGSHEAKSVRISKSGSPELRRALFLVMDCLIQTKPQDDPVYQFMDKKRAKGKPYLVYMTAGANKFLRIYYGRAKEYLASLEQASAPDPSLHILAGRRFGSRLVVVPFSITSFPSIPCKFFLDFLFADLVMSPFYTNSVVYTI